jgi:hypothetical protein
MSSVVLVAVLVGLLAAILVVVAVVIVLQVRRRNGSLDPAPSHQGRLNRDLGVALEHRYQTEQQGRRDDVPSDVDR